MNVSCIAVDAVGESFQRTLTTDYAASSYNLPVIVRGDHIFDYADAMTLWLVRDNETGWHVAFEFHAEMDEFLSRYSVEVRRWVGSLRDILKNGTL